MSSKPPSSFDRLELFAQSVGEYASLTSAMPLAERFDFLNRAKSAQRWAHILHAMMLRKYFAPADELSLVKVIEAVEDSLTTRPRAFEAWKVQRLADVEYQREFGSPWRVIAPDGSEVGLGKVILDDLYGGLLQGDWDKARRRHPRAVLSDHTVWDWCSASALAWCTCSSTR